MDAARHWARGGKTKKAVLDKEQCAQFDEDARSFGLSVDEIVDASNIDPGEDSVFEVFHDNIASVQAFLECHTQWRFISKIYSVEPGRVESFFVYQGMNYQGVMLVLNALDVKDRKAVFRDIQLMERAAIQVLNNIEE